MKKFLFAFAILMLTGAAFGQQLVNIDREGTAVGIETLNPVASTALTVPATAEWARICVRGGGFHVKYDAGIVTTSYEYNQAGCYLTPFVPRASYTVTPVAWMGNLRLIDSTDGPTTVYVTYFKRANK